MPSVSELNPTWHAISKWIPRSSSDSDWWWKKTGYDLQMLLEDAGYSLNEQIDGLLFLYHVVAPRLGPRPTSPRPAWPSFMTDDFSPIEYSWKWGLNGDDAPEIRYGIEAISALAGTESDPLNQSPTREILYQLGAAMPQLDLTWFHHFWNSLLGPGSPAFESGTQSDSSKRSTMFLAFEMGRNGSMSVKAYFIPVETPEMNAGRQITEAIKASGSQNMEAIEKMESFLNSDVDDSGRPNLQPFMLGIDCVRPAESRLKIYVRSSHASFSFVRNVMTLGGLRQGFEAEEEEFQDLWNLTLGLPKDTSPDDELPRHTHQTSGTCFYFDVGPKSAVPDVKAYIPVRHYAKSDRQSAKGLAQFLQKQGRGKYADDYLRSVAGLATKEGIGAATGVQTYFSAAYSGGKVAITSYLSPQVYNQLRWAP